MIEITNLQKNFSNINVLKNINLKINDGEIFGIIGHSGAGKSTLLRCINGLEKYNSGSLKVNGLEIGNLNELELRKLRKKLGMIFQDFNLLSRKDVYHNISLPMEIWGIDKRKIEEKVDSLLELIDLKDKAHSMPKNLSGGQKQRVAIARALALEPDILLCDEATSALDPETTKSILKLLRKINSELKITMVVVTHQMEVVKQICDRVALIDDGEIKYCGNVQDIFIHPDENFKKLLGEDEILPDSGTNIKIFFSKDDAQGSVITSMARNLNIDFSIAWGRLEKFRDSVLGSLIINISDSEKDNVIGYLKEKNISYEVIDND